MVTIKVFEPKTDKILGLYVALSMVEARSILLASGFLDDDKTWTRRQDEQAVIIPHDINPDFHVDRVWNIP
jgi:hypothetical protein